MTKFKEAELLYVVGASRAKVNMAEDQVQITSADVLFLEEEQHKKIISSEEEIRAEAQKRSHQDKVAKVKELEDQIKKLGRLQ